MNEINVNIQISDNISSLITSDTDLYKTIIELKKQDKNIDRDNYNNDPDNCIISKIIYKKVFPYYDLNNCRGDTLNTYKWTFGEWNNDDDNKNNLKLKERLNIENATTEYREEINKKVKKFKQIFLSIGNFTLLEHCRNKGGMSCINKSRGRGKLCDSWPLTLLCIQDYLSNYSILEENPLRNSFEENESTLIFFERYKNQDNGFELFCDDQYFTPKLYDIKESTYIEEDKKGKYIVKLDLFDGLSFSKPLPQNLTEMEQYIDRASLKIIERGKIILKKYSKDQ